MPFVTVGAHRLHYRLDGDGEPLMLIAGTGFDMSFWDELMPTLTGYRVLRFDNRGSGRSDVPDGRYSIAQMADDAAAVMAAAGIDSAHVYGASMGSLIAQELAVRHPERVRSLVLGATSTGVTMVPGAAKLLPLLLRPSHFGAEESFRRSAPYLTSEPRPNGDEQYLGHAAGERNSDGYTRQLRAQLRYTSITKLRRIEAPTLVLHGERDRLIPPANAKLVARLIPRARLHLVTGAGHLYNVDNPEEANEALLEFLLGEAEKLVNHGAANRADPPAGTEATILFTDIVDSTTHLTRLGDATWIELLERHNAIARAHLESAGGTEVRTTGDGMVALFPDPERALHCALALMGDVEQLEIRIRAGIHTGPVAVSEGDVHGLAVHVAARVADSAGPGEIRVSGATAAACGGVDFESRGTHALKGVPGEWELFSVPRPI